MSEESGIFVESGIFDRSRMLIGREGMARLDAARVIIFGVGGVGSWCAESLVRTGLRHLTIVDSDRVAPSNVNRQLMATTQTVGEVKVEAMRRHLLEVNPEADIKAVCARYNQETAGEFRLEDYDYVVDCIDSVADKALLLLNATRARAKVFSSMGAALKLDPGQVRTAEFRDVRGCALARALRQRFKRLDRWPSRKVRCVYSAEHRENIAPAADGQAANGSLMHITAIFGLTLAGLLLQSLLATK